MMATRLQVPVKVKCPSCSKQSTMVQRLVTDDVLMPCCGFVMSWDDAQPLLRAHRDTEPQLSASASEEPKYATADSEAYAWLAALRKMADAEVGCQLTALAKKMESAPQPGRVAVNPERQAIAAGKIDPLDVEYDGTTLRDLLKWDERRRRDDAGREIRWGGAPTPLQRSAISAHWSAELRAKVEASKQKEREQVVREMDDDGE